MITIPLVICLIGLVLYIVSSDKTRRQLCEDIGRILFAAGALAVLFGLISRVLYP